MSLGQKIQDARKEAGMTQAQLAVKIGVGRLHITKLENNEEYPSISCLKRIVQELDIPVIADALWNILS